MRRIAFRPRAVSAFTGTLPNDFSSAKIAVAYDNMVQLYCRLDFSDNLLIAPDTDKIIYVDFIGIESDTMRVLMINERAKLFECCGGETTQFDLGSVPKCCSTSLDSLYYITDNSLCCYRNGETSTVANGLEFEKLVCAKNGMAIALYTPGTCQVEILFKPFETERFSLPLEGKVQVIEWSTSQYLSLLIVTEDGKLQLWTQESNTYRMRCLTEKSVTGKIHSAVFVHDFDYSNYIETLDKPVYVDLVPSLARPAAEIFVAVDDKVVMFRECHSHELMKVADVPLNCSGVKFVVCDVRSHYTYGAIRRSYLVTICTADGLVFNQMELGSEDMTIVTPFSVPFLPETLKSVVKGADHLVMQMTDASLFDWTTGQKTKREEIFEFHGEKVIFEQNSLKLGTKITELPFVPTFWDFLHDNALVMLAGCENGIAMILYDGCSFHVQTVDDVPDGIVSLTVYSRDIFAACTATDVQCFCLENDGYQVFAKLECENPKAQFIPNPVLSLCVAVSNEVRYYVVRNDEFVLTKTIQCSPVIDLILRQQERMLMALTESALYQLPVSPKDFISQYDKESDYCLFTAATLADMAVIRRRIEGDVPTADDFRTRDENFLFPRHLPEHFPNEFSVYCPLLFPKWEILDQNAQRFVLSYALCKQQKQLKAAIPMLGIWALRTKGQRGLVKSLQLSSWKALCTSYMPLWAESDTIVRLFVEYVITKTKPSLDNIDEFLLLCVAANRIPVAKAVARAFGLVKTASVFVHDSPDPELSVKIQKNAFHAKQVHRNALAALFFLVVGMKPQALKMLEARPLLQLLVARLIDCNWRDLLNQNFKEVVNGFYVDWWNGNREDAQVDLIKYKLPECGMFSLDVHKYELLREIKCDPPNSLLVNMQTVPYYVKRQFAERVIFASQYSPVDWKKSLERFPSQITFDFGGDCLALMTTSDESCDGEEDVSESEAQEIQLNFYSTGNRSMLSACMERPYFESDYYSQVTLSQVEIVENIAKLFNCQYDEVLVKRLCNVARKVIDNVNYRATVATIFFALSYALSDVPLVTSILMGNINQLPIENYLDKFENCEVVCKRPDLLSPIADTKTSVCDNDINITNCLAFDSMSKNVAKNTRFNETNAMLFSFLHHRHQLLFNQLSSFRFSDDGLIDDIKPLGFDTINILKTMESVSLRERWLMLINDSHSSPFFFKGKFSYSTSEDVKMTVAGVVVKSICIDPTNNANIIVATPPQMRRMKISKENLDKRYPYNVKGFYDSPFAPGFPREKCSQCYVDPDNTFGVRGFGNKVSALFKSGYNALTAVDSHPASSVFVTGNKHGTLAVWHFSSKIKAPDSHVKFFESKIRSVRFSEGGDNLLVVDKEGRVYTTDFKTYNLICHKPRASAAWFNATSQFAVYEPQDHKIALYDSRCGMTSVVDLEVPDADGCKCPIDVWENQIALGNQNGCIITFDVRSHTPMIQHAHSDVVTCLKYHTSGGFLMSGSRDNSVTFIDVHAPEKQQCCQNILPDYNPELPRRGITALALSEQAIVAGGYSSYVRVWTAVADAGSALTDEPRTAAIDLRSLSDM